MMASWVRMVLEQRQNRWKVRKTETLQKLFGIFLRKEAPTCLCPQGGACTLIFHPRTPCSWKWSVKDKKKKRCDGTARSRNVWKLYFEKVLFVTRENWTCETSKTPLRRCFIAAHTKAFSTCSAVGWIWLIEQNYRFGTPIPHSVSESQWEPSNFYPLIVRLFKFWHEPWVHFPYVCGLKFQSLLFRIHDRVLLNVCARPRVSNDLKTDMEIGGKDYKLKHACSESVFKQSRL